MTGTNEEFEKATRELSGRRVRIIGDHPWAGCSAVVVSFDRIGMLVRLFRGDAYDGHECYVTKAGHYRAERKGLDW